LIPPEQVTYYFTIEKCSFPSYLRIRRSASMSHELQSFDWERFWLQEVIFLGLPTLITIVAFRGGPTLRPSRLAVLLLVLLGLTVINVILSKFWGVAVGLIRKKSLPQH